MFDHNLSVTRAASCLRIITFQWYNIASAADKVYILRNETGNKPHNIFSSLLQVKTALWVVSVILERDSVVSCSGAIDRQLAKWVFQSYADLLLILHWLVNGFANSCLWFYTNLYLTSNTCSLLFRLVIDLSCFRFAPTLRTHLFALAQLPLTRWRTTT